MMRVADFPKVRKKYLEVLRGATRGEIGKQIASLEGADQFFSFNKIYTREVERCGLWWASADMTKLAHGAFNDLPEWTPAIAAPEPSGMLHWAGGGIKCGDKLVDTIVWVQDGEHLHISMHKSLSSGALEPGQVSMVDADKHFSQASFEIEHDRATAPVIQLIGATWLLMQQPTIAEHKRVNSGHGHRGKQPLEINDVQIINLRRLVSKNEENRKSGEGREFHHRWIVAPHWRQQACGPGRKQRKPVYVMSHVKGPEGAPLKTERVNVWRR